MHAPVCADVPVEGAEDEAHKDGDEHADEVVVGGAPVGHQVLGQKGPAGTRDARMGGKG